MSSVTNTLLKRKFGDFSPSREQATDNYKFTMNFL